MGAARPAPLKRLGEALGHRFAAPRLLEQAVTHPSAATPARPNNQRLEFLGDRVFGLVIAEALLETYPDEDEGALAPRLNALVRRETLAEVAAELSLGDYLRLGRSEATSGGRKKTAILADAMEAVIAALYLDGGMEPARRLVLAHWRRRIEAPDTAPMDAKTRLQEWAQGRGMAPPGYAVTARDGPDHAPRFTVEASLASGERAAGAAASKKQAEQEAAQALLDRLGLEGDEND
ncbi:MAG TPA: ribonuclease III [Thermohalobaculum sp.]|nr:ribonuclease III [Thermohalobaculum sp.]